MIITAIIPCYQENFFIESTLNSMIQQEINQFELEILVIDGGSTDGTLEKARRLQQLDNRIKIIHNQQKKTPYAFNLGIKHAQGDYFVLINAHCTYPTNYIRIIFEELKKVNATAVSGLVRPIPATNSLQAKLVYWVSTSAFGVSNRSYRVAKSGFTDMVSLPIFQKSAVEKIGGYNEKLIRNQDNDLNHRLIQSGGKLYVTDLVTAHYHPPKSLIDFSKYGFKSGFWNAKTLQMGNRSLKWYHFIPGLFVLFLFFWIFAGVVEIVFFNQNFIGITGSFICVLYAFLGIYSSLKNPALQPKIWSCIMPFVFALFHISYGMGTWYGFINRQEPINQS